jgi:choline dehydrogenase
VRPPFCFLLLCDGFQPAADARRGTEADKALSIPTVPQPGLNGRTCSLVGGKIVGGTTTFNSSIYTRGLPAEFDDWATRLDLPSWSYDALLPLFKRSQSHAHQPLLFEPSPGTPLSDGYSGESGPWRTTSPPRVTYASATAFINATKAFGIPLVQSLNDPVASATAIAVHEITGEYGRRTNVFEDFLMSEVRPGFGSGLKVGTAALVSRLEIDGTGRCVGVWFEPEDAKHAGAPLLARARQEVVLTAGAVFSPQMLLLSGIGPKEDLAQHGIPCKVDLPGVGKGLSDHLGVYLPYSVPCVAPLAAAVSRLPDNADALLCYAARPTRWIGSRRRRCTPLARRRPLPSLGRARSPCACASSARSCAR